MRFVTNIRRTNPRRRSRFTLARVTCLITMFIGGLMSIPFIVDAFVLDHKYHHMTFAPLMMLFGALAGLPMFLFGLIAFFAGGVRGGSTVQSDIGRIRYVQENNLFGRGK